MSPSAISIDVESEAVTRALQGIREGMESALSKAVREVVLKGQELVKEKAPRKGQKPWTTGTLKENIKTRLEPLRGEVYTDLFYAWFVEKSTRPHWIGSPVLIKGVGWRYIGQHPGTSAQPMFEPTRKELEKLAPDITRTQILDLISRYSS